MCIPIERHRSEMMRNIESWQKKPLLRFIYGEFYNKIIANINKDLDGKVVEIGSGIGNFKRIYPNCISTDIFPNEWIDRIENAYALSFGNDSVSHLILFDVFHHLRFPGSALEEFRRVLKKGGRIIICDPYLSLLGFIIYGIFHHEPVGFFRNIHWFYTKDIDPNREYYAAQSNSFKIFNVSSRFRKVLEKDWNITAVNKLSAISYVLSGGFSKPVLFNENITVNQKT